MNLARVLLVVAIAVLLACKTASPIVTPRSPPPPPPKPKVALVLGGGAARGFAHVGVIRALEQGPVARAVRASSAIPGVFQPVQHMGKLLVDGGVVDNIPISTARAKGADIVIAVDISENVGNVNITNLVDVTLQATNIMFALNVEHSKKDADVLITPVVGDVGMLDFTQKKRCMHAGIEAARRAVPNIRKTIGDWVAAHVAAGSAPTAGL